MPKFWSVSSTSRLVICIATAAVTAASSSPITGTVVLDADAVFSLSWRIAAPLITFTLSWNNTGGDWAAFGLHPKPGLGMPDAEMFMCSPTSAGGGTFCQVRNSAAGYALPAVDAEQYLRLVSSSNSGGISTSTFSRTLAAAAVKPPALSYAIAANAAMGLIFAQGTWDGDPMPAGAPKQHTSAGRSQVNFYAPPAPTSPPSPAPPGPAPGPQAGVWPLRYRSNMTIARAQAVVGGLLPVSFWARISYDFPRRSQLWEYFELDPSEQGKPRKSLGGELWINETLFSFTANAAQCVSDNLGFDIIRPDWLQDTNYATTNFLLRQPEAGQHWSNYSLCDLYKIPNTLGMTNSWVVVNSSIAQPVRLEGPDNFDHPDWRSILEYTTDFEVLDEFPADTFAVPKSCLNASAVRDNKDRTYMPAALFASIRRALA